MAFGHLNHGKPPLGVTIVTGASSTIVELPTNTAAAAIAAGDVVAFATPSVTEAAAFALVRGTVTGAAIGVALEASTGAGEVIRVCVGGYVEGVNCAAGVGDGEAVMAVAAGQVDTNTAASVQTPVAVAITSRDIPSSTVTLYWFRKY
jgi:acyl-CoA reductase-like NAD-dependent aldehyde dehydrogenase